jgi:hypothetical protein
VPPAAIGSTEKYLVSSAAYTSGAHDAREWLGTRPKNQPFLEPVLPAGAAPYPKLYFVPLAEMALPHLRLLAFLAALAVAPFDHVFPLQPALPEWQFLPDALVRAHKLGG